MSYKTRFMNLSLPIPGVTKGPTWATLVNKAFQAIDEHDHSPGKGKFISMNNIVIREDVNFHNESSNQFYGIKNAKYMQLKDLSGWDAPPSVAGSLFNWKGDLWWQYATSGNIPAGAIGNEGTFVQLTSNYNSFSQTCALETCYINTLTYSVGRLEKISYLLVNTLLGAPTITLPEMSTLQYKGKFYLVQDLGPSPAPAGGAATNNITITPHSNDYIGQGAQGASHTINTDWGYVWLQADGLGRWLILTSG
tara:strand:+ start:1738 stop:2490 length:753 start_codon:yes stop_codon:yes gene_type:complete